MGSSYCIRQLAIIKSPNYHPGSIFSGVIGLRKNATAYVCFSLCVCVCEQEVTSQKFSSVYPNSHKELKLHLYVYVRVRVCVCVCV